MIESSFASCFSAWSCWRIAGAGAVGLAIWHFGRDLPDYQQLADYEPPVTTRVYAGDGRLLAEHATERRVFVPIAAIPKRVNDAFLSAEDKNFYTHRGVDPISIAARRADRSRTLGQRPAAGRRLDDHAAGRQEHAAGRRGVDPRARSREAMLATRIEQALSKDRILELYLNEIYLGSGAYGVVAAALTYFNKSLDKLTLDRGGLSRRRCRRRRTTTTRSRFPQAAKARRDWVLDRMAEDGIATASRSRGGEGRAAAACAAPRGSRDRRRRPISPRRCAAN